jgi:hypothetical protein
MAQCTPCLTRAIKDILQDAVDDEEIKQMVEDMPTCGQQRKQTKEKRAPSAYNLYISECMKTKPIKGQPFGTAGSFMRECAAAWKKSKGAVNV